METDDSTFVPDLFDLLNCDSISVKDTDRFNFNDRCIEHLLDDFRIEADQCKVFECGLLEYSLQFLKGNHEDYMQKTIADLKYKYANSFTKKKEILLHISQFFETNQDDDDSDEIDTLIKDIGNDNKVVESVSQSVPPDERTQIINDIKKQYTL